MAVQTIIKRPNHNKLTLEAFATKLLDKVIHAESSAAIERYIAVAVKTLGTKKINGYIIQRFIDRVTYYLNKNTPANVQEQENTAIARERLQQFRKAIAFPSGK